MFIEKELKVVIFIQVKQLVHSGGEFDNAQVVIQGDRAGTHEEICFKNNLMIFLSGGMEMVYTGTTDATL